MNKYKIDSNLKLTIISIFIAFILILTVSFILPATGVLNIQKNENSVDEMEAPALIDLHSENKNLSADVMPDKQKARVVRVIDGDTIEIENGKRVRLIGIDAPESVNQDYKKNTEMGKKASSFAKEKLKGKMIYLEKDISEFDKYGRLLRYVYLANGTFFNEYMVKEGMAIAVLYPPDIKYYEALKEAQFYAVENNKGIWTK